MRAHGVPTWPDPNDDSSAGWGFNLLHVTGFRPELAREIDNKMDICDRGRCRRASGFPLTATRAGPADER